MSPALHAEESATMFNHRLQDRFSIRRTPLLSTLCQQKFGIHDDLILTIHSRDEMLKYYLECFNGDLDRAAAAYLYSGVRAFDMTEQLIEWRFGGFNALEFLDFASGYGRVTRFLLSRLSPHQVTVSDVMATAVEFQQSVFEVGGIVSSRNPTDISLNRSYDIVQAISLFSHLPESTFRRWLSVLWAGVKPGGLLIFTVHDASLYSLHENRIDFVFSAASENRDLDPGDYGTTWVSEKFVRNALLEEISDFSYTRLTRGLNGHQDVYVVVKEKGVDFSSLDYRSGAEGFVDTAEARSDGRFSCSGWAAPIDRSQALNSVDLLINGHIAGSCSEFTRRLDVAAHFSDDRLIRTGWDLDVELPSGISHGHDAVMIVANGPRGMTILAMGCIHSLAADTARANLQHLMTIRGGRVAGTVGQSRPRAKVVALLERLRRTVSP